MSTSTIPVLPIDVLLMIVDEIEDVADMRSMRLVAPLFSTTPLMKKIFLSIKCQLNADGLQKLEKISTSRFAGYIRTLNFEPGLQPSDEGIDAAAPTEQCELFATIVNQFTNLKAVGFRIPEKMRNVDNSWARCSRLLLLGLTSSRLRLPNLDTFVIDIYGVGPDIHDRFRFARDLFTKLAFALERLERGFSKADSFAHQIKHFEYEGKSTDRVLIGSFCPEQVCSLFPNLKSLVAHPSWTSTFNQQFWRTQGYDLNQLEEISLGSHNTSSADLVNFLNANSRTLTKIRLDDIQIRGNEGWTDVYRLLSSLPALHTFHTRNCSELGPLTTNWFSGYSISGDAPYLEGVVKTPVWSTHHALSDVYRSIRARRTILEMPVGSKCCSMHEGEEFYVKHIESYSEYRNAGELQWRREQDGEEAWDDEVEWLETFSTMAIGLVKPSYLLDPVD